jgi:hypothetical protein
MATATPERMRCARLTADSVFRQKLGGAREESAEQGEQHPDGT